jgi:hypothetical protein
MYVGSTKTVPDQISGLLGGDIKTIRLIPVSNPLFSDKTVPLRFLKGVMSLGKYCLGGKMGKDRKKSINAFLC